jgi:hypothetical protein
VSSLPEGHGLINVTMHPDVHCWLYGHAETEGCSTNTIVRRAIAQRCAEFGRPLTPIRDTPKGARGRNAATGKMGVVVLDEWVRTVRELATADETVVAGWAGAAVERYYERATGEKAPMLARSLRGKLTPDELIERKREWHRRHDANRRGLILGEGHRVAAERVTMPKRGKVDYSKRDADFKAMSEASSRWPAGTSPAMWGGASDEFRQGGAQSGGSEA